MLSRRFFTLILFLKIMNSEATFLATAKYQPFSRYRNIKLVQAMLRRSLPGPARKQMLWCYQTCFSQWVCFWDSGGHLRLPKYYQVRICLFWGNTIYFWTAWKPLWWAPTIPLMASKHVQMHFQQKQLNYFLKFCSFGSWKTAFVVCTWHMFFNGHIASTRSLRNKQFHAIETLWATWEFTLVHFIMSCCYIAQKKGSLNCAAAYLAIRPRPT